MRITNSTTEVIFIDKILNYIRKDAFASYDEQTLNLVRERIISALEQECPECGHASTHGEYGCEYERGDAWVTGNQASAPTVLMAQGPCGCRAPFSRCK